MNNVLAISSQSKPLSKLRLVVLTVWFVLTNLGLSVITPAQPHPNCPCGCQTGGDCCQGKDKSSCSTSDQRSKSCCTRKPAVPSCCQNRNTSPKSQDSLPTWNSLCRCGNHHFQKIGLSEHLDLPPVLAERHWLEPTVNLRNAHFCYLEPSYVPISPPPEVGLC